MQWPSWRRDCIPPNLLEFLRPSRKLSDLLGYDDGTRWHRFMVTA